jgi:TPR repeat protein
VLFSVSLPGTQSDQNQSGARAATLQQQAAEARKGAEQGNAKDQALLASYYLWGTGVQKDETQAFKWYLKAAEQGELGAQAQPESTVRGIVKLALGGQNVNLKEESAK